MHSLVFILALIFLTGCTQVVKLNDYSQKVIGKNAPVANNTPQAIKPMVIIHPPAARQQTPHKASGLLVVGLANDWAIDADSALPDAVQALFLKHYENVEISSDCVNCSLIVHSEITHIDIQSLTMQATVGVELRVYDANFNLITRFNGQGHSSFINASRLGAGVAGYFIPFFGTALGSYIVKDTVQSALKNALAETAIKLTEETNDGVLARTWLPKTQLGKKQHGKQEYTAEVVAKSAGCNLSSDGIDLVSQEYFKETYVAHCWGKPTFNIACEFGRCALTETPAIAQLENNIQ